MRIWNSSGFSGNQGAEFAGSRTGDESSSKQVEISPASKKINKNKIKKTELLHFKASH